MLLAISQWYLWGGLLGLIWFIALISAGVLTWKNRHFALFILGFIFPLIWVIGAVWSKPEPSRHLNWQPGGRDDELKP